MPCPNNHDTAPNTCNNYRGYAQCWGFAYRLADGYYGSCPLDGWSAGSLNSLKAGDIVRRSGHVIWVTGVSGDTVRFADCNGDYHCGIRWDVSTTKSSLSSGIQSIWSAPYSITTEAPPPPDEEGSDMPAPFTRTIADGDYHITTALDDGMCLNVQGASMSDEANVEIARKEAQDSRIFTVTYLNNGFYKILNKHSGKSLDVYIGNAVRGTNVQQYGYHGGLPQQWAIRSAGDNTFYIQPRCSGHYLDVGDCTPDLYGKGGQTGSAGLRL